MCPCLVHKLQKVHLMLLRTKLALLCSAKQAADADGAFPAEMELHTGAGTGPLTPTNLDCSHKVESIVVAQLCRRSQCIIG